MKHVVLGICIFLTLGVNAKVNKIHHKSWQERAQEIQTPEQVFREKYPWGMSPKEVKKIQKTKKKKREKKKKTTSLVWYNPDLAYSEADRILLWWIAYHKDESLPRRYQ